MMSRPSAEVSAISPTYPERCPSISARTISAPTRVLPQPRPARMSQPCHGPHGIACAGRAQRCQSSKSIAASLGGRSDLIHSRLASSSEAIQFCVELAFETTKYLHEVLLLVYGSRSRKFAVGPIQQFLERGELDALGFGALRQVRQFVDGLTRLLLRPFADLAGRFAQPGLRRAGGRFVGHASPDSWVESGRLARDAKACRAVGEPPAFGRAPQPRSYSPLPVMRCMETMSSS